MITEVWALMTVISGEKALWKVYKDKSTKTHRLAIKHARYLRVKHARAFTIEIIQYEKETISI